MDATSFENIAHARSRLDSGARASRYQDDPAAAEPPDDTVRDGLAPELNLLLPLECFLRVLGGFFDSRRNFVGLAVATRNPAAPVADDDQRVEAEATASLDHGRT